MQSQQIKDAHKETFRKDQIVVEHGVSKTFYNPKAGIRSEEELEAARQLRLENRARMIEFILNAPAHQFAKDFPALIVFNSDHYHIWNKERLEEGDDMALLFQYNIVKNTMNRLNNV